MSPLRSKILLIKDSTNKNYYQILGVNPAANVTEIERSYAEKAAECHPDRTKGEQIQAGTYVIKLFSSLIY